MKILALVLAAAFALAACGQSEEQTKPPTKEQTAADQACSARGEISKQVDQLKGLTASTATTDGISASLKAIRSSLASFVDAQKDMSAERRQQFQDANAAFAAQLRTIAATIGRSLSGADAKTQATAALQQLGTAYEKTLAPLDCG